MVNEAQDEILAETTVPLQPTGAHSFLKRVVRRGDRIEFEVRCVESGQAEGMWRMVAWTCSGPDRARDIQLARKWAGLPDAEEPKSA